MKMEFRKLPAWTTKLVPAQIKVPPLPIPELQAMTSEGASFFATD